MTFLTEQPVCSCGLYIGQTCSRQPCLQSRLPPSPPLPYPPVPLQVALRTQPAGCICPPGANLECENPFCPRKPPKGSVA